MPGKDGEEDQEKILRRLFLCCDRLTEDTQEATVSRVPEGAGNTGTSEHRLVFHSPVFRHILGVVHQEKKKSDGNGKILASPSNFRAPVHQVEHLEG